MDKLPFNANRLWQVNNHDDYAGNIINDLRIDLDFHNKFDIRRGQIVTGDKIWPHTSKTDVSGMARTLDIKITNAFAPTGASNEYVITDGAKLYRTTSLGVKFALDVTASSASGTATDMAIFGQASGKDILIVGNNKDLWKQNNGTWTPTWWTVTLGQAAFANEPILAVFRQPFLLLILDGNKLYSVDQANIPSSGARLTLPAQHTGLWLKVTESKAYIGVKDTSGGFSGVWEYDPVNETAFFFPHTILGATDAGLPVIDNNQLVVWCPDGIVKRFSGNGFDDITETPASKRGNGPSFWRNGAAANKYNIFFLAQNDEIQMPVGVYVYNKILQQFYHYGAFSLGQGDPMQMVANDLGALYVDASNILAGFQDKSLSAPNKTGLWADSNVDALTSPDRMLLYLPKVPSTGLLDTYKNVWLKYRINSGSGDSVVLKYRNNELNGGIVGNLIGLATWVTAAQFTTVSQFTDIATGYEVIISYGQNAGLSAHISSFTKVGGTYTVNLDASIGPTSAGSSPVFMTNFLKAGSYAKDTVLVDFVGLPSSIKSQEWIQLKLEIQGSSPVIKDVILEKSTITDTQGQITPKQ